MVTKKLVCIIMLNNEALIYDEHNTSDTSQILKNAN